MKKIVLLLLIATSTPAFSQSAADSLSDSLHPAGKVITRNFDETRPTYLRSGSLVCQRWQTMRGTAEDLAKADDSEQDAILRRYDCAVAPARMRIDVMRPIAHSLDELAEVTYGYIGIRWKRSDGTFDHGFVGPKAVEN